MSEESQLKKEPQYTAWIAACFLIFGIGGVIALLVGSVAIVDLLEPISPHDAGNLLGLPLVLLAGVMMLFGGGKWKQWGYLWVLFSIPIALPFTVLADRCFPHWARHVPFDGKPFGILLFTAPMVLCYWARKSYYKWREASLPSPAPAAQIINNEEASKMNFRLRALCAPICALSALSILLSFSAAAQTSTYTPDWCKDLPRPEYKTLQRVLPNETWFEVYKVAPATFAIYEPHQSEETIAYLIVGTKQAVLFDTGMGIADIQKVVRQLTSRPIVVMNSHTHDDHVGDNWRFPFVFGMDTDFTKKNAKGSVEDAQAEVAPSEICGDLPKGFDAKTYRTKPWHISITIHDGFKVNLGGRTVEVIATPGHTPDAISLIDRENGLLFTGDTYYPAPIWLFRPETDLDAYVSSVKKLAALAPGVKIVLGAHNVPVADSSVLAELVTAIENVRAGKIAAGEPHDGKAIYKVGKISFLMKAAK